MLTLDLDKCKDLRPCRQVYQAGDAYCAMGKIFLALGFPIPVLTDSMHVTSKETNDFIVAVGREVNNMAWAKEVSDMNDSLEGNLRDNHERAFRLGVDYVLRSKLVQLKQDKALQGVR
jgi:hypothetical protein